MMKYVPINVRICLQDSVVIAAFLVKVNLVSVQLERGIIDNTEKVRSECVDGGIDNSATLTRKC